MKLASWHDVVPVGGIAGGVGSPDPVCPDRDGGTSGATVPRERPALDLAALETLGGRASPSAGRRPVECGDLPFVIRRDGTWLYRGSPINRKELVCLFSSVVKRDAEGAFWLETPAERGRIEVEDTPWIAVELDWKGCGTEQVLSFRTNVDQVVVACETNPIRIRQDRAACSPTPYLKVRDGQGLYPLEARISRPVYYELAAIAVPGISDGRECYGVWSCGRFFPVGELAPGEA